MENKKVIVMSKASIEPHTVNNHQPYHYNKFNICSEKDGSGCDVAFYEIPPRKANYPFHYHAANTEVFYIISGKGLLESPEGRREVGKGDVIICPKGSAGAHKLINLSDDEMLEYLDVDTNNHPDVIFYPYSNKMNVVIDEDNIRTYNKDRTVNYYDGE